MYLKVDNMLYKWNLTESAAQSQELTKIIHIYRQMPWHSERLRSSFKIKQPVRGRAKAKSMVSYLQSYVLTQNLRRLWAERTLGWEARSLAFILDLFCLSFPISAVASKALISTYLC